MEIVFVCSHVFPANSKVETRTTFALAKQLKTLGNEVTIIGPLPKDANISTLSLARRLDPLVISTKKGEQSLIVFQGKNSAGAQQVFLQHDSFVGESFDDSDKAWIFGLAVKAWSQQNANSADVFHIQGHNALPSLWCLKHLRPSISAKLVLSLYTIPDTTSKAFAASDLVDASKVGMSPLWSHAHSIVGSSEELLNYLRDNEPNQNPGYVRIATGLDAGNWNPATDSHLPVRFNPTSLSGKSVCKAQVQERTGLPLRHDVPLFLVTIKNNDQAEALLSQKEVIEKALRNETQLVIAASPDQVEKKELFIGEYPERIGVLELVDDKALHGLLAGADIVWLNDSHESTLMCRKAQRYGAVPMMPTAFAPESRGVDCSANLLSGNAFLYEKTSADELTATFQRAASAFQKTEDFQKLQSRNMRIDYSWERLTKEYLRIYEDDERTDHDPLVA